MHTSTTFLAPGGHLGCCVMDLPGATHFHRSLLTNSTGSDDYQLWDTRTKTGGLCFQGAPIFSPMPCVVALLGICSTLKYSLCLSWCAMPCYALLCVRSASHYLLCFAMACSSWLCSNLTCSELALLCYALLCFALLCSA